MFAHFGENDTINPINKSNPLKHTRDHVFNWSVLANAPKKLFQWNVLEAYYIVLEKPTLNVQLELNRLNLFRSDVTWLYYSVKILTPWVFKF